MIGGGLLRGADTGKREGEKEIEVGPPEDLMREHGVLRRVLLIYGEVLRRIGTKQDFPPEALADAAGIIRSFAHLEKLAIPNDIRFKRHGRTSGIFTYTVSVRGYSDGE